MATVTGFTSARMLEIENETVVDGHIDGDDLILVRRDLVEINAGNVRGPQGVQGPPGTSGDVGDIKASIATVLAGWLEMGTSVPNADVAHPALWAIVPASWKAGSTLNLPSMDDRVFQGGGVLGALTGANTKVLVEANLPPHTHNAPNHTHTMAHTHSIAHDHGSSTSGLNSADHTHSIAHDHASVATSSDGSHSHTSSSGGSFYVVEGGGPLDSTTGATGESGTDVSTSVAPDHSHTVNLPAYSGDSGTNSVDHTHSINLPAYAGSSGAASISTTSSVSGGATGGGNGTASPVNVEQAALRLNFFIKY